jgi:hypothetical protein
VRVADFMPTDMTDIGMLISSLVFTVIEVASFILSQPAIEKQMAKTIKILDFMTISFKRFKIFGETIMN